MLFRRRRKAETREETWRRLAAGLRFIEHQDGSRLLAGFLDLESTPLSGPLFQAANTGGLNMFAFDFLSDVRVPGNHVPSVGCLLVAESAFCPVPLRLDRQLRSQLAGIQAGASGARVVDAGTRDDFGTRVTVVARDTEVAARLLTPEVRRAALRLLERSGQPPTITASDRQLLAQVPQDRFDLEELESLMSGLLSLYLALEAAANPGSAS